MSKKILLVEDQENVRHLVAAFLSKHYEVVSVRNGLEAMGWLNGGSLPDVILTGDRMPELSGEQLANHLRCSGLFCDIPVVIMCENTDETELRSHRETGISDIIRKPLNMFALENRLKQLFCSEQNIEA